MYWDVLSSLHLSIFNSCCRFSYDLGSPSFSVIYPCLYGSAHVCSLPSTWPSTIGPWPSTIGRGKCMFASK